MTAEEHLWALVYAARIAMPGQGANTAKWAADQAVEKMRESEVLHPMLAHRREIMEAMQATQPNEPQIASLSDTAVATEGTPKFSWET